jgi:tripartite-type tricarboxylate transporter receptor subunit TctC
MGRGATTYLRVAAELKLFDSDQSKGGGNMKSQRSKAAIAGILTVMTCIALWSGNVFAQDKYPSKPIQIIVNYPAGGPVDIPARILIGDLAKELGVSVTIEYKPGAGGMIGGAYVATSKPDGYTLLFTSLSSIISAPFLEKGTAAYDALKDFTQVASAVVIPNVLTTHSSSPLTSLEAVIKAAKEKPGSLTCSTPGAGTTAHLVLDVFKMHGIDIIAVPTKGGAPAATSVLGKHTDLGIHLYSAAIPHVKSGAMRLLATSDNMAQEPKVPTFKEKGFPEASVLGSLMGFLGPRNLPKPIQDQLASATKKVVQIPAVKKAFEDAGYTVDYRGADELAKRYVEDYQAIEKLAKAAGLGKFGK